MSDKPKVYQGVRVKTTVRELLQKRRALQEKKVATISQSLPCQDVSSRPSPLPDMWSANPIAENSVQPQYYNVNDNQIQTCGFDNQDIIDLMLQIEDFTNNCLHPATESLPWSQEQFPPYTEYSYQNWTGFFASESPALPSPLDSTHSPPQGYSSSSSPCYSDPAQIDLCHDLPQGNFSYTHDSLQQCYSSTHWSSSVESGKSLENTPCSTSDWWCNSTVDEGYPTSSEMYYVPFSTQTGLL